MNKNDPLQHDWKSTLLAFDSSIQQAIGSLDTSGLQIVMVVRSDGKLAGTLTDGDIRRGLLRGLTLASPIEAILHRAPLTVSPQMDRSDVLNLMSAHKIHQLPVVDENRGIVGLHLWDEILSIPARNTLVPRNTSTTSAISEIPEKYRGLVDLVRELYGTGAILLHEPRFLGNEKRYLEDCIDSTFVSSIGPYVTRFEDMMREITGARAAIATVNGTAALHMALILAGVRDGDEVITQPLSFVATCNAIAYQRAYPVFVDVERDTLSLSPSALRLFLEEHAERRGAESFNRKTGRCIRAIVPMHTFGLPGRADALRDICAEWGIALVEDAAESLGSRIGARHTGTFGALGTFSFNGNKTVTSGGGGCIVTDDPELAVLAKHLTTTAKKPHAWDFHHDQIGYNYRMPNLNAALACAQLEQLPAFLTNKRETADRYARYCGAAGIAFLAERDGATSNHWLNAVVTASREERDAFLAYSHSAGIMARPAWVLMPQLPAFAGAYSGSLENAQWLADRVVCLPSSVRHAR
jgi:perosamine synthetase